MNANTNKETIYKKDFSLGFYLLSLREKNNLTHEEVANKIGVSKRTIYYWENDFGQSTRKPGLRDLLKLSLLYNVSVDSMLMYN